MKPFWNLLLAPSFALAAVHVDLSSPPGQSFDPSGMGTAAPVWNGPARYETWAEGFRRGGFQLFRFPNGTLSNEYHWNGAGTFDSVGIWHDDAKEVKPGFTVRSKWRGTTKDNYDSRLPSHLTDGDTTSIWWGETLQDSILPWAVLDLGSPQRVDSLEIFWGDRRPQAWRLEAWGAGNWPAPHQADPGFWATAFQMDQRPSARTQAAFGVKMARFYALRPLKASQGVQVREVRLFSKGKLVTANLPDPRAQTKVVAISAHPGNDGRDPAWIPEWTFDRFMDWTGKIPQSQALVCVNFGTGTPQEAADWVRYANVVKKYGVKKWHVGNEMDGNWEEGGPVDPAQYAIRFVEFVKAMKAVDPTIEIYGPGSYSMEFASRSSGRNDGLSWMESFLWRIGNLERMDKQQYLDGIDFHAYPYWFDSGKPTEEALLRAVDGLGNALDTLKAMASRRLDHAMSRKISLSEFQATVKVSALTLEEVDGLAMTMMLQDLWSRFPERSVSVMWEPSGGEPMNPDGSPLESYGSLRIFTPARSGLRSDLGEPPTSAFWGHFLTRLWMGPLGSRVVPQTKAGSSRVTVSVHKDWRSILATNPSNSPETLIVPTAISLGLKPSKTANVAEVLVWGPEHYHWTDRTASARAIPNLGPTASPLGITDSVIAVPARSVVIVRLGSLPASGIKLLHASWTPERMNPSDTLAFSASVQAEGKRLTGATWSVPGSKPQALASFDGARDGSHEAVVGRIPASALPRGRNLSVQIVFHAGSNDSLVVPLTYSLEDLPRAIKAIALFDQPGLTTTSGQSFWTYGHSGNGTKLDIVREEDGNGGHFAGTFQIIQPSTLTYPNFALAGVNLAKSEWGEDWKQFRGLVLDIRTRHNGAAGKFVLQALTTTVTDYDDFMVVLPNTEGSWKRLWIRWEDFAQEGWGKAKGVFNPDALRAIQFRANGEGQGTLDLDNLCFFGTEGPGIELKEPARPMRGR